MIQSNEITVAYFQDEKLSGQVETLYRWPSFVVHFGNIDLKNKKTISIVGTRQITSYGMEFCRKLIEDWHRWIPSSSVVLLMVSIFLRINWRWNTICKTIGVVAHGLNEIYPKNHKKYVAKVEQNGGFMTEFWSSSNPERKNFVRRNRIVAGISEATIVIESAERGGLFITANIANDYTRDVFAVPVEPPTNTV